jgi:hypothetical protein
MAAVAVDFGKVGQKCSEFLPNYRRFLSVFLLLFAETPPRIRQFFDFSSRQVLVKNRPFLVEKQPDFRLRFCSLFVPLELKICTRFAPV